MIRVQAKVDDSADAAGQIGDSPGNQDTTNVRDQEGGVARRVRDLRSGEERIAEGFRDLDKQVQCATATSTDGDVKEGDHLARRGDAKGRRRPAQGRDVEEGRAARRRTQRRRTAAIRAWSPSKWKGRSDSRTPSAARSPGSRAPAAKRERGRRGSRESATVSAAGVSP